MGAFKALLIGAAVLGLAACSDSNANSNANSNAKSASPDTTGGSQPATTPPDPSGPPPSFSLGTIDLQAVNAAADLPGGARTGVQGVLDRYLNTAVVDPLRSGERAGDLSSIFAAAALERTNGADRAALVDEGLPKATLVKVGSANADVTALIGPEGLAVVVATIKMTVTGTVEGGPLTVERTGELLLAADGDNWRVTGYDLHVSREAAGSVTTTTVRR